ncbi:M48 family metallopeptidase [Pseudomonas sp. MWU318]|uniref:M48 family metallopeptidase n=1 Tax=Pseudomonas sp. MWU318 TaxID=2802569 RepID=UPI001927F5FC|nr:SprT family zinc-dependent metalloprotease [Pseudomonas sp. MWU318]
MLISQPEVVRVSSLQRLLLDGQEVECRLTYSKSAKKLRIKVRPDEVEVVIPKVREKHEALAFVTENKTWVLEQIGRAQKLRSLRRPEKRMQGCILFRGDLLQLKVIRVKSWHAPNKVVLAKDEICITCAYETMTPTSRSLENWLRKQARESIEKHVEDARKRLNRSPHRIYVMEQRTKWGNCSALGNLSFNWRLIMAPDYVLHYIVMHEMVHLAIPDHSQKFWLAVQSHCSNMDRARQWLVANGHRLKVDLSELLTTNVLA